MGFTSKAKMEQMGVHDMIWGRLTDEMQYQNGDDFPFQKFIHPRAEPEICFLIKKDIDSVISLENVKDYVEGVAAAIEIIDSRYQNFKFSLEDVIADNCSSAGLVIGKWHSPELSLDNLKIDLMVDGEIVQTGSSVAILGNPWESLVAAARLAAQYGETIKAGHVIMAGAATSAVYLKTGQKVSAKVESLGEVSLNIK
jgi:2-oxo-3-hexenedioate decarboxylase